VAPSRHAEAGSRPTRRGQAEQAAPQRARPTSLGLGFTLTPTVRELAGRAVEGSSVEEAAPLV